MAGPLGVSHLMLFSRSEAGNINLRIAIAPRGPTLNFRVDKYSLCRDVIKSQKHSKAGGGGIEHLTPPLLVMNNFTSSAPSTTTTPSGKPAIPKHLESLTTSVFQSLFPPISPQATPLTSIRRVLLLDRQLQTATTTDATGARNTAYILHLRHYAITSKPLTTLSRGLKRLRAAEKFAVGNSQKRQSVTGTTDATTQRRRAAHGALPNLHGLADIGDYLLDPTASGTASGYTSASETEADTDAEVEVLETSVARKVLSSRDRQRRSLATNNNNTADASSSAPADKHNTHHARPAAQKRAIKLTEIGPRMTLRLVKVEEGVCAGKVLWHEYLERTKEEERALDRVWEARRAAKEERKRVQRENVKRKKGEERVRGRGKGEGGGDGEDEDGDGDGDEEMEDGDWSDDEFDGMVGEEEGEEDEEMEEEGDEE